MMIHDRGLRGRCNIVAFVCIDKDISHILQAAFAFISTPSSAIARAFVRIQSLTVAHFEGKVLQAAITSGSSFKNSQSFSNNSVPCLLPFCMQETPKLLIFVINVVAIFDISRLLLTIREFLVTIEQELLHLMNTYVDLRPIKQILQRGCLHVLQNRHVRCLLSAWPLFNPDRYTLPIHRLNGVGYFGENRKIRSRT